MVTDPDEGAGLTVTVKVTVCPRVDVEVLCVRVVYVEM
jgi:hypothetical protein